jgi:hypothetical protein
VVETDFGAFEAAFRRLSGALNRKWNAVEFRTTVQVYFDTLKHADLGDVLSAEVILRSRPRWPKVGDWVAALPARTVVTGERVLRQAEAAEYLRAHRLHWFDEPCCCPLCFAAGVSEKPLRFVPDFLADDTEARAYHPTFGRVVTTGHWAHGDELRRWYVAKAAFMASAPAPYRRALALVLREPGQEG